MAHMLQTAVADHCRAIAQHRLRQDTHVGCLLDFHKLFVMPEILANVPLPDEIDVWTSSHSDAVSINIKWDIGCETVFLITSLIGSDGYIHIITEITRGYFFGRHDTAQLYAKRFYGVQSIKTSKHCIIETILRQIIEAQRADLVERLHPELNHNTSGYESDDVGLDYDVKSQHPGQT